MLRISPKLIDVDGNRVATDDLINGRIRNHKGIIKWGQDGINDYIQNENGRFPTQLFTNIKNKQFKYVKNIT